MHVFLTGPKQAGKSTLLNAVLHSFPGAVGGFRTVRLNTFLPGFFTVHLLPLGERQIPTEKNLLFVCGTAGQNTAARFDVLGCRALTGSTAADLIVMDELGPHEEEAAVFQAAVRKALDGNVPILGVLQQAHTPFLKEIAHHPKVFLISVTLENREGLKAQAAEIQKLLRENRIM